MKKRMMILCGLLSLSMIAGQATSALAESTDTAETEVTATSENQPPEMPGGEAPDGQPPEMPDGEAPGGQGGPGGQMGEAPDGQPPEMPSGEAPGGQGGPGGQMGEAPDGQMGGMPGQGGPGGSAADITYTAVNTFEEDAEISGEAITSEGTDESAVLVSGDDASVTLSDVTVTRTSDDSTGGDSSSFYGVGAALLATAGEMYVHNASIDTDAAGGAGVFAYGDSTVYVADITITTQQGMSGGIHAAGGGTLYAWDLDVTTNGGSAAAIRSDRGGGTMMVSGGSYTSNGSGSPAIYCTADISVADADLTATDSEAVCIEGLNTLRLYDCDLSGNMPDQEQNDCTWTVIVYQSMSGDSEVGNGTFEMSGGTLTSGNGGLFYTTNTECTITLQDVEIIPSGTNAFFLRCTGNNNQRGWGTAGANGSDCLFTAISQEMTGDVVWDTISTLDFYMTDSSTLTGAVTEDETFSGGSGDGYCNLYLDETSTWVVTGDSTLTALYQAGTIVDEDGNTVTVQGTDGTVYVEGTSAYTVTVETWSDSCDTTGASVMSAKEDHITERPEQLA